MPPADVPGVTGLRRAALLCALLLIGVTVPAAAADAESAAHARRVAAAAAAQVHALQPRVQRAMRAYHQSLRALSESVSRSSASRSSTTGSGPCT